MGTDTLVLSVDFHAGQIIFTRQNCHHFRLSKICQDHLCGFIGPLGCAQGQEFTSQACHTSDVKNGPTIPKMVLISSSLGTDHYGDRSRVLFDKTSALHRHFKESEGYHKRVRYHAWVDLYLPHSLLLLPIVLVIKTAGKNQSLLVLCNQSICSIKSISSIGNIILLFDF